MLREYQTTTVNPHGLEEEQQWVRILASADPVKGMLLVFVQKMCTAYHEFEPAWKAGALKASELPYFRERLAHRVERVLLALKSNGLETLDEVEVLRLLAERTRQATSMDCLAELAEEIHAANHVICNALEKE